VPPAVIDELGEGRNLGMNLPDLTGLDWIEIRRPFSERAAPLVTNLGPGETEVLMLALEKENIESYRKGKLFPWFKISDCTGDH